MKRASDKTEFHCVYKGAHYRLACFSDHIKHKVPSGQFLLIDNLYRTQIVPQSEVHISTPIQ